MADELHDEGYLVIDGTDGRAHYVALPPQSELEQHPTGAVVEVKGAADRDPREMVAAHVRRLEALLRADIVERVAEGVWHVPADLSERGRQYDAQRLGGGVAVELKSHLPIERQTRVIGATWLDQQLMLMAV